MRDGSLAHGGSGVHDGGNAPNTGNATSTGNARNAGDLGTARDAGKVTVLRSVRALRDALRAERAHGRSVGLVPTMGFFHDGHLSLMRRARAECDVVVVSLFVNPTQFAPGEDFDTYPRDEERDLRLAAEQGVAYVFSPPVEEIYPPGFATLVRVDDGLTTVLCGSPKHRGPEHFAGVTTVVTKLFNLVGPDVAYFGQKDAQQSLVIKKLVRDLNIPVRIVVCPTVREPDGLAMSSRNAYLTAEERDRALALSRALHTAERVVAGGTVDGTAVVESASRMLTEAGVEPEYLELRSTTDLAPVDTITDEALLAVAARIGQTRLIDNVVLTPPAHE